MKRFWHWVLASLLSVSSSCVCLGLDGKDRCVVQSDCLPGFTCVELRCVAPADGGVGGGGGGTVDGGAGGGEPVFCDAGEEGGGAGGADGGSVDADAGVGLPAWAQEAYVKASNTASDDLFGFAVALSADGNTLAVGAPWEDSAIGGINGNPFNNLSHESGAVYVFRRSESGWAQEAYVKASSPHFSDHFGSAVALSRDGNSLAVGSPNESGGPSGNGLSGAVYVFQRAGSTWSQEAYVKASNAGFDDNFGHAVALSGDGNTMAVTAPRESSNAKGVNGDQNNNQVPNSGAAYVFRRTRCGWIQRAYVKASNTGAANGTGIPEGFGLSAALSSDGSTLAIGAPGEASNATGIDGNQLDPSAPESGAVYVFRFAGGVWAQEAYVKASNAGAGDRFGEAVSLSGDGAALAVGAAFERSNATGVDGNQADNSLTNSGAAYLFRRAASTWTQEAYLKASNTERGDLFGSYVALSADGSTLAVTASWEASGASGINGLQLSNSMPGAGAVYVFRRPTGAWAQEAYVKASNPGETNKFGNGVLSADGRTFAAGALYESSSATGINGNQADTSESRSGAAYLFRF
jgi:hypothetical protein